MINPRKNKILTYLWLTEDERLILDVCLKKLSGVSPENKEKEMSGSVILEIILRAFRRGDLK